MAQSPERRVIYTAQLMIVVPNRQKAHDSVNELIQRHGGFVQRDTMDRIVFRVPPAAFHPAIRELDSLGQVNQREIQSQDVTEAFFDFKLRIEVAEGSRKRLMDLLDKSAKLEDVLRAEQDIRRLTEEIERLKGQLRAMEHQIEYAAITVQLIQAADQVVKRRPLDESRFPWMREVGIEQVLAPVSPGADLDGSGSPVSMLFGPQFKLGMESGSDRQAPDGFSVLLDDGDTLLAATPEDFRMRVQAMTDRHVNDIDFWRDALKEELARNRGYIIDAAESVTLDLQGAMACRLRCRTNFSGEGWQYDVWLVQRPERPHELLVVEFVRTDKADAARMQAVESAVQKLDWRRRIMGG